MSLPVLTKGRTVVLIVVVAFGISLTISFRALIDHERVRQLELSDNLWIIAQVEVEYLRFLAAFDRFALDDQGDAADRAARRKRLRQRLDVLWSRLPLLWAGAEGRQFESIGNIQEMARDLDAMLRRIEPEILGIEPGDMEAYAALRGDLEAPA